jgi:lipid II isoglutaminyl synthase (glutamine-hydrolysing)
MTDSAGRHAAQPAWRTDPSNPAQPADEPDTLILRAESWMDDGEPGQPDPPAVPGAVRRAGRHASPRPAADGAGGLVPAPRPPVALDRPVVRADAGPGGSRPGDGPAAAAAPRAVNGSKPAPVTAPGPARQRRPGPSALRLVWVYPDLLSTYGDRGNLLVLSRRARLRGIEVQAVEVNSDQAVPHEGDIYLLGGGEDLPQILAARRLRADDGLTAVAGRGSVVFAVCAGYQIVGHEFGGVEGEPVDGLGLLDISSGRGERRGVGELVADVDPELGVPKLTGFENHQGVTSLGAGARPLARISLGVGNGDGTEGAYSGKVLGTYLHGPALARNPGLADLLLSWVVGQLAAIDPAAEEWAARLRMERLAAVAQ